jgi:hypothetical protein
MIKSNRMGAMIVVIALAALTASVQAQSQTGEGSKPVERNESTLSLSRRVTKAFEELVAKSTALTEKRMFKGFRLGSCQPPNYAAPSIGTPPRAESALSLCQP